MEKYANVNAVALLDAVTKALNEIDLYRLKDIKSDLKNSQVLDSEASSNFVNALNSVCTNSTANGSIYKLEQHLKKLKTAAGYIKKCQTLYTEIKSLKKDLYNSSNKINSSVLWQLNSKENTLITYENKINSLLA